MQDTIRGMGNFTRFQERHFDPTVIVNGISAKKLITTFCKKYIRSNTQFAIVVLALRIKNDMHVMAGFPSAENSRRFAFGI
jgi:hypothetical protein